MRRPRPLTTLLDVAGCYDAVVFDQWGVLHDGSRAYPQAAGTLEALKDRGIPTAVLSNSGKRADLNLARICSMGFDKSWFSGVMSSGEALWQDIRSGVIPERTFFPVEARPGDCAVWAEGLGIELTVLDDAQAVLLMGLPDGEALRDRMPLLRQAQGKGLPLYCSNPDLHSPRADGVVLAPGSLARAYGELGGRVTYYGKPYRPIFDAIAAQFDGSRFLMIGDSMAHDILGAHAAGWDGVLIQNGLYRDRFAQHQPDQILGALIAEYGAEPTFTLPELM